MNIITKNWEKIDPWKIDSYLRQRGYEALQKAVRLGRRQAILDEVKKSGLQGRGGGGFPTGEKWEISAKIKSDEKYFICNLDESEPGTWKDRLIAEKSPHQILEGLILGAIAIGAKKAIIYINGNYKQQAEILKHAIGEAHEKEFLGKGILGSAFDVEVEIFEGAGAYICGEETALINSIEGKRGEPRLKPPFPPCEGLFGKPTIVNNAETLANIPIIIRRGADFFVSLGTRKSPGTKIFLLSGAVKRTGWIEAPLGITVRDLIFSSAYGGGIKSGKDFWFAQIGGSSGRLMPISKLDQKLLYACPSEYPIGSGSILVVDKTVDIRDLLFSWADFFHRESCGKCVPCREGTFRLFEIAKRLKFGRVTDQDRANLDDLLWTLSNTTFCPLGAFAAVAWKDALDMFSREIFSVRKIN